MGYYDFTLFLHSILRCIVNLVYNCHIENLDYFYRKLEFNEGAYNGHHP